jgi:hypothetical protein
LFEVRDETTPWGPTVSFDCNDLGDSKTIWLKVEDEAGNVDSIATSAMTVTDASVRILQTSFSHAMFVQPVKMQMDTSPT